LKAVLRHSWARIICLLGWHGSGHNQRAKRKGPVSRRRRRVGENYAGDRRWCYYCAAVFHRQLFSGASQPRSVILSATGSMAGRRPRRRRSIRSGFLPALSQVVFDRNTSANFRLSLIAVTMTGRCQALRKRRWPETDHRGVRKALAYDLMAQDSIRPVPFEASEHRSWAYTLAVGRRAAAIAHGQPGCRCCSNPRFDTARTVSGQAGAGHFSSPAPNTSS
jgi:hypothetical protein